jgi:GntR family colanic acid and biofilm gene transcriptional regulator
MLLSTKIIMCYKTEHWGFENSMHNQVVNKRPKEIVEKPDLPPVFREMLHEQIFTILKRNLMIGRFAPGQRLPLRTLAASLGTSLMPVRDALQRLESMGVVTLAANRTLMVPRLTKKALDDVALLRILLEGEAAARAATERTDAELEELKTLCSDIGRAAETNDLELFLEANYRFHMKIAEMSRIVFLDSILLTLWMRLGPAVRQSKPGQASIRKAVGHHTRAYEAIAAKNPQAAAAAIQADIMECFKWKVPVSLASP